MEGNRDRRTFDLGSDFTVRELRGHIFRRLARRLLGFSSCISASYFALPTLIAEIEFRGWTDDGNLRHASYKNLRELQDNAAVYALD